MNLLDNHFGRFFEEILLRLDMFYYDFLGIGGRCSGLWRLKELSLFGDGGIGFLVRFFFLLL